MKANNKNNSVNISEFMKGMLSNLLVVSVFFYHHPAKRNPSNSHFIFCAISRRHEMHLLAGVVEFKTKNSKDKSTVTHKHK